MELVEKEKLLSHLNYYYHHNFVEPPVGEMHHQAVRRKRAGEGFLKAINKIENYCNNPPDLVQVTADENDKMTIQGLPCSFESVQVRSEIQGIFEVNKSFILPKKYSVVIMPRVDGGYIMKIVSRGIS